MSMTIYFKNGETLHVAGKEGERIKRLITKFLTETRREGYSPLLIVINEEDLEKTDLILNIDEVACIR